MLHATASGFLLEVGQGELCRESRHQRLEVTVGLAVMGTD